MKKLAILFIAILFIGCGGDSQPSPSGTSVPEAVKRVWDKDGSVVPVARDAHQTTTKGSHVYSRTGLSQEHLNQVDEALTELFADVRAGFPGEFDEFTFQHGNYDIFEPSFDCVPSPEQQIPSFYVKDTSLAYDGSQYDQYNSQGPNVKDGRSVVLAPERVFGMMTPQSTPRRGMMLVCPDLRYWRDSIRYGGEHIVAESGEGSLLALADQARTHTVIGHPFIRSRQAGLKGGAKTNWSEFAPRDSTK